MRQLMRFMAKARADIAPAPPAGGQAMPARLFAREQSPSLTFALGLTTLRLINDSDPGFVEFSRSHAEVLARLVLDFLERRGAIENTVQLCGSEKTAGNT
jgi:hypothetical protein